MTPSVQGSLMDPEPDPWILMCPRLMTSAPDAPGPSTAPRVLYGGAHDDKARGIGSVDPRGLGLV